MNDKNENISIKIIISEQKLYVFNNYKESYSFSISSSKNGTGQEKGSGCTPLGDHKIKIKIGEGEPINRVFVGRRPLNLVYSTSLAQKFPERDWILTRILWLTGLESGFNRGGNYDSLSRYIYIHGTPDEERMGSPQSHGCIRMQNSDLLELFDLIKAGTHVSIIN
tara:strand:+ start:5578 stop:6075 length:498 start_codon:yes stop_codon:yes gene_type:complete